MAWSMDSLANALARGIAREEAALRAEQAVHGLDSFDELQLHPVLADALAADGHTVFRETPYPGQPETLPRESERERCDLVIGPAGATGIADTIRDTRERRRAEGTLFAPLAARVCGRAPGEVLPADAMWIEVKTFGQFTYSDRIAGPNRTYGSQFSGCLADIRKLSRSRDLTQAALLIVLFSAAESVAVHDLTAFVHRCLDKDLPATDLYREHLAIADRIGNQVCTVGLIPVRCAGADYAGTGE